MTRRSLFALAVAGLAAGLLPGGLALAQQQPPPALAAWAPRWKKGDWWVVRTYQQDLRDRMSGPAPSDGGAPPELGGPSPELPGYPPLRDGIPQGWKHGNRFRFEALRKEGVKYPDDGPNDPPEMFLVIGLRALEGDPRPAELWYTESDLTLAKVVTQPGTKEARTWELSGKALLEPPVNELLGVPLDWPDFEAAAKGPGEQEVSLGGQRKGSQKMRTVGAQGKEEVQLRLAEVVDRPDRPASKVLFSFRQGESFWVRFVGTRTLGELTEQGKGQ